jgi:hypothetical protein
MKKLINDPNDVVAEALIGIEAARPEVRVDHANRIIYRRDAPVTGKVGLVSGGGSGHEPLHGGFVVSHSDHRSITGHSDRRRRKRSDRNPRPSTLVLLDAGTDKSRPFLGQTAGSQPGSRGTRIPHCRVPSGVDS